jgi:hypothetical protein
MGGAMDLFTDQTISRRAAIKASLHIAGVASLASFLSVRSDEPQVLVNHVGFLPGASKYCVVAGGETHNFVIVGPTNRVIYQGRSRAIKGDLGEHSLGDFSEVTAAGEYEVRCNGRRAARFEIGDDVYLDAIKKCVSYFARQRCGDSKTGYNSPCHLDDGVRRDDQQRVDVTGGWHDACDVRKWVSATIYGMIGLHRVLDALGPQRLDGDVVLKELRWGNQYFHRMQLPDGSLMSYCGGDDGNHFTDNIAGTKDDRPIHVEVAELPEQFHFVAAQAALFRQMRDADPHYADSCLEAGRRCLKFCVTHRSARAAGSVSAGIIACVAMHRATHEASFAEAAAAMARSLIALQVTQQQSPEIPGFFLAKPDEAEPYRDVMHGNLPLIALCELCERLSDHPDHASWRDALRRHCEHLLEMSKRSVFGITPFGLYAKRDPGGGRRAGEYWYRWFMKPRGETSTADWWVGTNAHLASTGVGLCRAARLLRAPSLSGLAQRHLDWIVGVNPFNASTITRVGRNQPSLFETSEFRPTPPLIPGGVMNGIGGTEQDEPTLLPGSYHTCEYWTPMVAYTMWLMAELHVKF